MFRWALFRFLLRKREGTHPRARTRHAHPYLQPLSVARGQIVAGGVTQVARLDSLVAHGAAPAEGSPDLTVCSGQRVLFMFS